MVNTVLFKQFVNDRGLKYSYLSGRLGISYASLNSKMNNKRPFKGSEIFMLQSLLGLSDQDVKDAFLCPEE